MIRDFSLPLSIIVIMTVAAAARTDARPINGSLESINGLRSARDGVRKSQSTKDTPLRKKVRKPLRTTDDCPPTIRIYFETAESSYTKGDKILIVGVLANGGRRFRADWKTSSGKITSGQGTLAMTVETEKNGDGEITITLRIIVKLNKRSPCHVVKTTTIALR